MRFLTKTEMCEMFTEEDNTILADIGYRFLQKQDKADRAFPDRRKPQPKDLIEMWVESLNL